MRFNWDKIISRKGYVLKGAQYIYGVQFLINKAGKGSKYVGHHYGEHKDDISSTLRWGTKWTPSTFGGNWHFLVQVK